MMNTTKVLITLALGTTMAAGCVSSEDSRPGNERPSENPSARGPIGKGDHNGSCRWNGPNGDNVLYCGGQSDGNCWCDDACSDYGDCCADKVEVCDAEPLDCPDPNDPTVHYVGEAAQCMVMLFYCGAGQTIFSDPCGCGCVDSIDNPPQGDECGGLLGLTCGDNQYCDYTGDGCGNADGSGYCKDNPVACFEIDAPVCGCDGNTYGNECDANSAGSDMRHDGSCDESLGGGSCPDCNQGYGCQFCWGEMACVPDGALC